MLLLMDAVRWGILLSNLKGKEAWFLILLTWMLRQRGWMELLKNLLSTDSSYLAKIRLPQPNAITIAVTGTPHFAKQNSNLLNRFMQLQQGSKKKGKLCLNKKTFVRNAQSYKKQCC